MGENNEVSAHNSVGGCHWIRPRGDSTRGLAAQVKRTFYVVIEIDEITDVDGYKAMTKIGPANIVEVKHADGRYLARTDNLTALDGATPKRFVMIAFDSMDKANGFYQNTKEMTAMRIKATKSRRIHCRGVIGAVSWNVPLWPVPDSPTGDQQSVVQNKSFVTKTINFVLDV